MSEFIIDQVLPVLRKTSGYRYVSFTEFNPRWVRVHIHVDSDTDHGQEACAEVHNAIVALGLGYTEMRFVGGMPEREDYMIECADQDPWKEDAA